MVDIPTGYFFLTTTGSVILGIGVAIVLAKLFRIGSSKKEKANNTYWEKVEENKD
jgi:predicted cobalt transporter CbtA